MSLREVGRSPQRHLTGGRHLKIQPTRLCHSYVKNALPRPPCCSSGDGTTAQLRRPAGGQEGARGIGRQVALICQHRLCRPVLQPAQEAANAGQRPLQLIDDWLNVGTATPEQALMIDLILQPALSTGVNMTPGLPATVVWRSLPGSFCL